MAYFELSKNKLKDQHAKIASQADHVSYSFKTNPLVGELLENMTDCSFSIHSRQLLSRIKDKSRVWFFSQGWDNEEIGCLISQGIERFVVDNTADLEVLLALIEKKKTRIDLMLRIRLKEHTVHTGKHFVFGMFSSQVNKLIPELRKNKNINKLGIHFHRKTQNISEWSLYEELKQALNDETFSCIDMVDIGGGFPVTYKNSRADQIIDSIFARIKKLRDFLMSRDIQMIIEPGRFLAAPPIRLVTEVKSIYDDNIIVDASVYNTANDTFVAHVRLRIDGELDSQKDGAKPYTIKGITPCSMDIFRYRAYLRPPKPGQQIIFLNAGAYSYSSDFCGLEKLKTKITD